MKTDRTHDEMNRRIAEFIGHDPVRRYTVTDDGGCSSVYTANTKQQAQGWLDSMRGGGLLTDKYEVGLWEFWPAYTSDDLPRSLLASVEQKLGRYRRKYILKLEELLDATVEARKDLYLDAWMLITAPAEARCRAICAVLDEMEAGNG